METFLDQIGQLAMRGHIEFAYACANEVRATEPLKHYLAHAMIAAARNDGASLGLAVKAAKQIAPDDPFVAQTEAVFHLQAGATDEAEKAAKLAVRLDDSARSWRGLANVYIACGRHQEAERTLREGLSRHNDPEAFLILGDLKAHRGDEAGALEQLAKAWAGDPGDGRAAQTAIEMYKRASWMIGVAILARITRAGKHEPETRALLDLLLLEMVKGIEKSPLKDIMPFGDEATTGLRESLEYIPARAQLRAARALVESARFDDARLVVARLSAAGLSGPDLAELNHVQGFLQSSVGDLPGAIAFYQKAVSADSGHWEAACNAVNLCLRIREPSTLSQAEWFVSRVPLIIRRLNLFMTYNEAAWLAAVGRVDEALELIAFMRKTPSQLDTAVDALERSLDFRSQLN